MKEYAMEFAELWHHIPSEFERTGGFWFVRAGRNLAKPNYQIGPKQIENFGFHFIISGRLQLTYGEENAELEAGDIFCLFPHFTYEYRIRSNEELQMVWINLEGPQVRRLLQMVGLTFNKPYRSAALDETALQLLGDVEQLIWNDSRMKLHSLSLMSSFYRLMTQLELDAAPIEAGAQAPAEGWVQQAVCFFDLHYTETLRIDAVASMFNIHRSYFSSLFAQQAGISPQQYLLQLRIGRAKQLLHESALPIGEIALSVGYPDPYLFSRAFKKKVGCSPSEYRNRTH